MFQKSQQTPVKVQSSWFFFFFNKIYENIMNIYLIIMNIKVLFSVRWPSVCALRVSVVSGCIFKKIIYDLSSFSYDHCAGFNTQDGKWELSLFAAIYHLSEDCL